MTFRNIRRRAIANGYRSGLEEDIGLQLKEAGVKAEYEPFRIPFLCLSNPDTTLPTTFYLTVS